MSPISPRRTAAALLAALALAFGVGFSPTPAAACGSYVDFTPEAQVRRLVASHYAQLGRGEAETQQQLWLPQAQVISLRPGPKGPVLTTQSIAEAAAAWAASDQAATWSFSAIEVDGDVAKVKVRATQGGVDRDELMVLSRVDGVWRLAGKISLIAPRVARSA